MYKTASLVSVPAGMGEIFFFECMAGPEKHPKKKKRKEKKKKKSRPADWSSGLEIPFVFLRSPTPIWQPAIPRSAQACSVTWRSSHPSVQPVPLFFFFLRLLLASAARKETNTVPPFPLPWILPHYIASRQEGPGIAVLLKDLDVQAKAMGHQGSPLTEATSDGWDRPTLVYRPSCPGYFTTEPEPVPSPELDSTDELTYNTRGDFF